MNNKYEYEGRNEVLKKVQAEISHLNKYYECQKNYHEKILQESADQALNYHVRMENTEGLRSTLLNREAEISISHVAYYLRYLTDPSFASGYRHSGIGELLFTFLLMKG